MELKERERECEEKAVSEEINESERGVGVSGYENCIAGSEVRGRGRGRRRGKKIIHRRVKETQEREGFTRVLFLMCPVVRLD